MKKKLVSRICLTAAFLLPAAVVIGVILWGGVNVPFWDDWRTVNFYRETTVNGFSLPELLDMRANEHRIIVPVLVRCLIWALTDCNVVVELVVSQVIILLTVGLIALYWNKRKAPLLMMLPAVPVVFSMKLGMLQVWAMSMQWWLLVAFVIASFYCYQVFCDSGRYRYYAIAMICAFLSAFCSANGILIWIAYAVLFAAQKIFEKKRLLRKETVIALLCGAVTYVLFFQGGVTGYLKERSIRVILVTFLRMIANPFFEYETPWLSYLYGAAALTVVGVLVYFVCADREITKHAFPLLIVLFFFGSMLMVTYGRVDDETKGIGTAASAQYAISPAWAYAGAYLLFAELLLDHGAIRMDDWKKALPLALYSILLLVSIGKYPIMGGFLDRMQADAYILQHWDETPAKAKTKYVYPSLRTSFGPSMNEIVSWMQEDQKFLFGEEKEYAYPYDDYCFAEREDDFQYPGTEIGQGKFSFGVNGDAIPGDRNVTIARNAGLSFSGWALDNAHGASPSAVYVELDGNYYHMVPCERSDVAEVFGNDAYLNSGVKGYVTTDTLAVGTHQVMVIVISADGNSYYEAPLLTVEITG